MKFLIPILITIIISLPLNTKASELTGYIALENRYFPNDPAFTDQKKSNGPTLILEPEYFHISKDDKKTFTFKPFAHLDNYDNNRNHIDIRQLDLVTSHSNFETTIGISKVFWGVTESNHLVDIINQTDLVEDIDTEDKLGQPMLQ
jgi:hypothetical protein